MMLDCTVSGAAGVVCGAGGGGGEGLEAGGGGVASTVDWVAGEGDGVPERGDGCWAVAGISASEM